MHEQILLSLWKLKGIGKTTVDLETLRKDLAKFNAQDDLTKDVSLLRDQGFLEERNKDGQSYYSLTPLGIAILRKIEEDRLQEL